MEKYKRGSKHMTETIGEGLRLVKGGYRKCQVHKRFAFLKGLMIYFWHTGHTDNVKLVIIIIIIIITK